MKKLLALLLSAVLMLSLLTGCRSNQVQTESDGTEESRPADENTQTEQETAPEDTTDKTETDQETEKTEGAVKTGLAVAADLSGSRSAGETAGLAQYDIALVAVTVDDNGVITDCVIDAIHTGVDFDQTGTITSDLTVAPQTRGEMKDESGWHDQANALAESVVGKTVDELKNGTAGENDTDKADSSNTDPNADNADQASADTTPNTDTAQDSTAVVNSDTYIKAIEKAVKNATHLGAQKGDKLVLAAMSNWDKSAAATEEAEGSAQLDITMTALTKKDGVITSCVIDGLQAPVNFDRTGVLTSDLNTELRTKNELGEEYGMKENAGSKYEWNEQAAYFAKYVTGKTADEVKGIAVDEYGAPADEDLASTVTIKVGGFMELIEKAAR